ncbi:MAG: ribokinase [Alphaproteobacteria bacterium]|nr:ribokinase [Alphaproteobacteria bacterium]MCB9699548.1 ribokinase [Alphaproteobacteria bacterium]
MSRPRIVVLGSLVVDLVVRLPHLPRRHETLIALDVARHLGGKGFNQAVAAARCGASTSMIACAGDDDGWGSFRALLEAEGVDHRHVRLVAGAATGMALPMVLPDGDNSIVLLPGANAALDEGDAERAADLVAASDALLLQQEVSPTASLRAVAIARERGVPVFLNPAPARPEAAELAEDCDWLLPNEVEAAAMVGRPVRDTTDALEAAEELLQRGPRAGVVITLGARGCVGMTHEEHAAVPALKVAAVDPTGAGDAFCGAFAVARCEGMALRDALRFAAAAGAHAVTRVGAEPGLARRAVIEALLASGGA